MSYREVTLTIEGLRDRDKFYHDLLRRATMIISCSGFGGKEIARKFDKFWPVADQIEKSSQRDRALALLKQFKDQEQQKSDELKVKEIIDARRT